MNTTTIPADFPQDALDFEGSSLPADMSDASKTLKQRLIEAWARLTERQKITLYIGIAAIFAVIISTSLYFKQPAYGVLFSNMSEQDGGAVIDALKQMNVPYKFSDGNTAILVPTEQARETRLALATQGLPKGGHVSFELLDKQKFGVSQFVEQVNYQRALQGELARTIESVSSVRGARVHLAIPRPTVFVRDEQKPTASIFLDMYPGRFLDQTQIAGIRNLVAASVPNLNAANISLIDQDGQWISKERDKTNEMGLDEVQLKFINETEAKITQRINDILLPIFGEENAKARVSAEIDFAQMESTEEKWDPKAVLRSEQTHETVNADPRAILGVPGATTNQPPVPATAPLTNPDVQATAPGENANQPPVPGVIDVGGVNAKVGDVGRPLSTQKDATRNFEAGRTITHRKDNVGRIKRLTAAVTINNRKDNSKTGNSPLSEEELAKITDLVKGAMGYLDTRGDNVAVVNALFTPVEKVEIPLWKDPEMVSKGMNAGVIVMILLSLISIMFFVIRPVLKAMSPLPPDELPVEFMLDENGQVMVDAHGNAIEMEAGFELQKSDAVLTLEKMIEDARSLVKSDPMIVVNIIKDWTGTNSPPPAG